MGALEGLAPAGADALATARALLLEDRLIPYLGPGVLALGGAAAPASPEAVAAALHKLAPAPARVRANMWSVAQFIENRRHRRTLTRYMADIFAAPPEPNGLHRRLASLPLSLIVDAWYDGAMAAALRAAGRSDFLQIQGAPRADVVVEGWTRAYDPDGVEVAAPASPRTLLYAPHGSAQPAQNFLVSDSDYVEVLTEIDIQTPIPDEVQARRASRGFLFLGCRFHDQMLRTYARQIMKRSAGPHFAVVSPAELTRNEARFLADHAIAPLATPLAEVAAALIG